MRWRIAIVALALAVLAGGCGDEGSATATAGAETAATVTAGAETVSAGGDETEAVEAAIRTWILEGDCDLMTAKFLEAQTFESNPKAACERFEALFEAPQYGAEDIVISDVEIDGERASAVVGGGATDATITYKLVREDGVWKIDSV